MIPDLIFFRAVGMNLKDVKSGKTLDIASSFLILCNSTAEKPVAHVDFYLVS